MHKYNSHGATDVTGFGLLGHAQNLAKVQKNEVSFVIHNLPVIAKMAAVAKACGNMFQLLQGHSPETSGWLRSTTYERWPFALFSPDRLDRGSPYMPAQRTSGRLLQGHREAGRLSGLDHRNRWEGQPNRSDHRQAKSDRSARQREGRRALVVLWFTAPFHQINDSICR